MLAATIAPLVKSAPIAADAARVPPKLAKADLVSGMVGEFPELQGVMGRYYALHDGEAPAVADAIRDHYAPRGPTEPATPSAPVSIAVALADKLDQLTGFFAIGEKPTGSGDPYALRRAALGRYSHHPRERTYGLHCYGPVCRPLCLLFMATPGSRKQRSREQGLMRTFRSSSQRVSTSA